MAFPLYSKSSITQNTDGSFTRLELVFESLENSSDSSGKKKYLRIF